MKIAIMQPYVFPYLGYFQLIRCVDTFIFYDDVHFIKRGWINRNKILLNGKEHTITFPCIDASQNKLIKDVTVDHSSILLNKIGKTIEMAYQKAPYYKEISSIFFDVISLNKGNSIARLAIDSIVRVSKYLELPAKFKISSEIEYHNQHMARADRLIDICLQEDATRYINVVGGVDLYSKDYFSDKGVPLSFLQPVFFEYKQFNNDFVRGLSILDLLMFCSKDQIIKMLNGAELV
jgi:WbqC-like protein